MPVVLSEEGPYWCDDVRHTEVRLKDLGRQGVRQLVTDLYNEGRRADAEQVQTYANYIVWGPPASGSAETSN